MIAVSLLLVVTWTVPRHWCGRHAAAYYEADEETWLALGDEVARWTDVDSGDFQTGDERFDGEWAFVTCQMTILGLGQIIDEYPEHRQRYLPAMRQCGDAMQSPGALSFGTRAWGQEGLSSLESDQGHAYLGYLALALGVLREHDPGTPHAAVHDQLIEALVRRVDASDSRMFETYPDEAYPTDMSAVIGAIGQHAALTGTDRDEWLQAWSGTVRERYVDPDSGLLYQAIDPLSGDPRDQPRGSGTALAIYFLSFADPDLSSELHRSLTGQCFRSPAGLGFGAIREYPPSAAGGFGDIDSGPVVFGFSTSGTGFALAGARLHQDRRTYVGITRTAHLFGVPIHRDGRTRFVTGGPLGNAILLAMFTAPQLP
jgi:hypothetical protein